MKNYRTTGYWFLVLLTFSLTGGQVLGQDGKAQKTEKKAALKKPNILWLIAEDFGPHLGCYGTKQVWTPNLDKLAKEGMRFTHFYTTAPVCSPSRSAFMTGMYQTTIDAHNHRSHRDDGKTLPKGVRILTDWLRDGGYFTANIRLFPGLMLRGTGKTDWNFAYKGQPFDSDDWKDLKKHQPFYAQVNFQETHRKFHAPKKADPSKVEVPPYYPDHPLVREDWAAYLDAASELDRKIGLILQLLASEGLLEDTIIIFFGDNGQAHVRGKQFCYESGLLVPLLIRWPQNHPLPKGFQPDKVEERLLEAIDLSATTLSLAGIPKPPAMQGKVFLGDKAEPPKEYVFGARDRCDETVDRIRTVRDKRYRYIKNFMPERPLLQPNRYKDTSYPVANLMRQLGKEGKLNPVQAFLVAGKRPAEELYDLEADPYEIKNLASSPEHQAILQRLRAELERWIETTNDQGRIPEPPEVLQFWQKTQKEKYKNKSKK